MGASDRGAQTEHASLWSHGDFVRIWVAATLSQFGTSITRVAIPVIGVLGLGAGPLEFALVVAFQYLPWLLFSLPVGVLVDRFPRRPILVGADAGRAILLLSIPVAGSLGVLTIVQLYAVGFLVALFTVLFDVTDQSYLPTVVGPERLVEANSKLQVTTSAAQVVGQPVGGAAVSIVSAPGAITLDAASYVLSAILLSTIALRERRADHPATAGASILTAIAEGVRYVRENEILRSLAACTAIWNLFSKMTLAIFAVYAFRTLGLGPVSFGLLGGAGALGFVIGGIAANPAARLVGLGPAIACSAILFGCGGLVLPFASPETAFPIVGAWFLLIGIGTVAYDVNQVSLRQAITPEPLLGRLNGTMRFVITGANPVGALLGGVVAELAGIRTAVVVSAIGGAFAFLPLLLSPVWHLVSIEHARGIADVARVSKRG